MLRKEETMQALIITAYHNYEQLRRNLKVYTQVFDCYVHIDQKSDIATEENLKELNAMQRVTAIAKYKINWGSYLHMMAIVELMQLALKKKENHYFHIISGDDYPIRSFEEFETFFADDNDKNYLEVTDITDMAHMRLRYEKYHFMHLVNRKGKNRPMILLDKVVRQLQYHLPIKRKRVYQYKGLVWGSITRDAAEYVIKRLHADNELRILKYCEIAEEFFIQNYLMESEFRDTVVSQNYRYAIWDEQHVNGPRVLDERDYEKIKGSECFFARKIVMENALYDLLEKDINKK